MENIFDAYNGICPWKFSASKEFIDSTKINYNNIPSKKFVVGFFTNGPDSELNKCEQFILKNKEALEATYVHPPLGKPFIDYRPGIDFEYSDSICETLLEQLNLFKKYNLPVQATFNLWKIKNISPIILVSGIQRYIKLFGQPDYIITFDNFVPIVKEKFPDIKLVRTVNDINFFNTKNEALQFYDIVVFKNNFYNLPLLDFLKTKYNIKTEFVLYNECVTYCPNNGDKCDEAFKVLVEAHGLNEEIARQVILPEELTLFGDYLNYIKLSPKSLHMVQQGIDVYTQSHWTKYNFLAHYAKDIYNRHIRSNKYNNFINNLAFNLDEKTYMDIINIKNKLWTEQLGKPIHLEDM